ncbi:MAG: hypothetical protein RLY71_4270, partial [Pseudomonadota bacterium]
MHRLLAALLGFHRSFSQVSHDR